MPLTLSHRPKLKQVPILAQNFHLAVVLLKDSEHVQDLLDLYTQYGLKYLHVPLTVGLAHKTPPTRAETGHVRVAADIAAGRLREGHNVFVHCSAGIHRTGTFAYAVLRRLGHDRDSAMCEIRRLRPETYDGFLPTFIRHWAEDVLVDQLTYTVQMPAGPVIMGFEP